MTYRAWWAARWLLWEEQFGTLIRQAQREERYRESDLASKYQRSVALLKARQESDGTG